MKKTYLILIFVGVILLFSSLAVITNQTSQTNTSSTSSTTSSSVIPNEFVSNTAEYVNKITQNDIKNTDPLNWPADFKPKGIVEYLNANPSFKKAPLKYVLPKKPPKTVPFVYKSGQTSPMAIVIVDNYARPQENILRKFGRWIGEVRASSTFNGVYVPLNICDGVLQRQGEGDRGEWAVNGGEEQNRRNQDPNARPWIEILAPTLPNVGSVPFGVDEIVVYDRVNNLDNIISLRVIFSDGQSINVNRANMADNIIRIPLAQHKQTTSVRIEIVDYVGPNIGIAEIEIIDKSRLAAGVEQNINRYLDALRLEGYFAQSLYLEQGGAVELKDMIKRIKDNPRAFFPDMPAGLFSLDSVILVGSLPAQFMEYTNPCNRAHEVFPTDYYFMDLDCVWQDNDGNGIIDAQVAGANATLWPEIACGRIDAKINSYCLEQEKVVINNYFERNIQQRRAQFLVNKALVYNEDEFASMFVPYIYRLYKKDNVDHIYDYTTTSADDFINRISGHYDWLDTTVHGTPSTMSFVQRFRNEEIVRTIDVRDAGMQTYFSFIDSCGPGRFTEGGSDWNNDWGYLGGYFILGNTNGLACISNTAPHYCISRDQFYNELGNVGVDIPTGTIGKAFKSFLKDAYFNPFIDLRGLNKPQNTPYMYVHSYVLLGDPTLKPFNNIPPALRGNMNSLEEGLKNMCAPTPAKVDISVSNQDVTHQSIGQDHFLGFKWHMNFKPSVRNIQMPYAGANWSRLDARLGFFADFNTIQLRPGRVIDDLKYEIYIDGQLAERSTLASIVQLNNGERIINWDYNPSVFAANDISGRRFRIVIDPTNVLDELNEGNNTIEGVIPRATPCERNERRELVPINNNNNAVDLDIAVVGFERERREKEIRLSTNGIYGFRNNPDVFYIHIENRGRELQQGEQIHIEHLIECIDTNESYIWTAVVSYPESLTMWNGVEDAVFLNNLGIGENNPGDNYRFHLELNSHQAFEESDYDNNSIDTNTVIPY
jgi:hypothetical protein